MALCTICAGNEDDFSCLHMQFLSAVLTTLQHSADGGGGCAPWMALRQGRSELGLQMPVAPVDSAMKVKATSTHMITASTLLNLAIAPRDSSS